MASLTGQTIASTYDALLKITDNGPITASLKQITDGLGNNTPLFLSATTVYVNGNFRVGGALYDVNNEPGTNGQFLVSTGTGVDWRNISEANLITGSGTTDFIAKFTASGAIGSSIISENANGIGIDISATQKLHVAGNGLFTGTLTASNVSGSNTGDETKASIETKLGAASASNNGFLSSADWSTFNAKQAALSGTGFVKVDGTTISYDNSTYALASRNIATTAPLSGGGDLSSNRTLSIAKADSTTDGYLSSDDWATFNSKVPSTRTITINGETHNLAANRTYNVNVGVTSFNTRTGAVVLSSSDVTTALGYTPALNSRIMTINGVGYDLSADRSWSVGTVTSVGTSAPLTGGTITGAGTIGITQANASTDGYLSSIDWNTFNDKQPALGYTPENVANKGAINGYASLDGAGKVPSTQLPSYVDDVVEVANFAALPATGETGKIYITLDTNFVYRWSGSVYVKISEPNAIWGSITGTLANQTDLQNALNAKVDNTRTITINGTEFDLSANRTYNVGTVTSVSGTGTVSGLSLSGTVTGSGNLTLGGTLSLTSSDITNGLGYTPVTNARTLSINGTAFDLTANRSWNVGTVTSVGLELGTTGTDLSVANSPITSSGNITLNIPTASATNRGALSSTDWSTFNNKQNALTLTTTGNSGSATLVGSTLNIPTYTLAGLGGQPLLTNPVTGTGTSGYLTRFTGSTTVGNSSVFDNGSQIGIGTTSPGAQLHLNGAGSLRTSNSANTAGFDIGQLGGNADADSYIYQRANANIIFGTNNATRAIITSAGNVGIGTSSPSNKLVVSANDVFNQDSSGQIVIRGVTTPAKALLIGVDTTSNYGYLQSIEQGTSIRPLVLQPFAGNVGIGTSSPECQLHIAKQATGGDGGFLFLDNSAASTLGNKAGIRFATDTGGSFSGYAGYFECVNTNAGNGAADLTFGTWNGSSRGERMRITSGGNVGIGTSSPATRTHFVGGGTTTSAANASTTVTSRFDLANPAISLGIGYISQDIPMIQSFNNGTGNSVNLTINPFDGKVLIGTTSVYGGRLCVANAGGNYGISVRDAVGNTALVQFTNSSGTEVGYISTNGTTTTYSTNSDYRLKEDFKEISGLDKVSKIKIYNFKYKISDFRMDGVIAHELQEVLPYAVSGEKDGEMMQGVDYSKIVPVLVKAIQEQQAQIEELKEKLK